MDVKEAHVLDWNDPLSKALDVILSTGTAVFVTKDGKYVGLIDDRNIRQNISDPTSIKCGTCAIRSAIIYPDSNILEVVDAFLTGHFRSIPVLDRNSEKIVGLVTKVEVLKGLLSSGLVQQASVSEFMKSPVYTIEYGEKVASARKLLKEKNVHKLLVVDKGRPRGIVGTFDLSAFLIKPKERARASMITNVESSDNLQVSEILRERIVSVDSSSRVSDAISQMIKHDVSDLLVEQNHKPVGVLTSIDLFKNVKESVKDAQKPEITISGLGEQDMVFYPIIVNEIGSIISKYSKNFSIENVRLIFKKGKSVYEGRLHLTANGSPLIISYEQYKLEFVVRGLVDELDKVLRKQKNLRTERKVEQKRLKRRETRK